MFKRFLVFTLGILLLLGSARADLPDFASMSFDELNEIKQALDKEYFSRPESEGRNLGPNVYYVGRDILPGTYYMSMVYPSSSIDKTTVNFYDNEEELMADTQPWHMGAKRSLESAIGSDPKMLVLHDGEIVCIEWGSLFIKPSEYDPEDYYKYDPPAKTIVPNGKYQVGADIPAGTYLAYPAQTPGGGYDLNGRVGDRLSVYSEPESCVIVLHEGDEFKVTGPLAMKKQEAFEFE